MNKVEQMFFDKAINRYGITLYSKRNALDFVKECKKNNIELLGIDGFFITEKSIQPSLEDSIDFSSSGFISQNIYEEAREFLERKNENLYFEIVCQE